jgi:hypothetical protein
VLAPQLYKIGARRKVVEPVASLIHDYAFVGCMFPHPPYPEDALEIEKNSNYYAMEA